MREMKREKEIGKEGGGYTGGSSDLGGRRRPKTAGQGGAQVENNDNGSPQSMLRGLPACWDSRD